MTVKLISTCIFISATLRLHVSICTTGFFFERFESRSPLADVEYDDGDDGDVGF